MINHKLRGFQVEQKIAEGGLKTEGKFKKRGKSPRPILLGKKKGQSKVICRPPHPERTVLHLVPFNHVEQFFADYEGRFEREYGYFRKGR